MMDQPNTESDVPASLLSDVKMQMLTVLPQDPQDAGTQRCRMGPKLMSQLGLHIGRFVEIPVGDKIYVCAAWPRKDCCEGYIMFDSIVSMKYKHHNTANGTRVPRDKISQLEVGLLQPLQLPKLQTVTVSLVFHEHKDVSKAWIGLQQEESRLSRYSKVILRNLGVTEQCVVDCKFKKAAKEYGISHIVINKCKTQDSSEPVSGGIVHSQTEIIVEHVESLDRFEQKNARTEIVLAGLEQPARMLKEIVDLPFKFPQHFQNMGLECPKGILLRGPPGCGKTSLVKSVAAECDAHIICISGSEIFGAHPGESEGNLRKTFKKAAELGEEGPCILFIDEIDALCPRRGKGGATQESRVVAQLLTLMDGLSTEGHLVVVGATNRPNALDPAIRRPGRFDREVFIGVPTMDQRLQILTALTRRTSLNADVDLHKLAEATPGYVGADLTCLYQEATYSSLHREVSGEDKRLVVNMADFTEALHRTVPSTQRGSDIMVDNRPVLWQDIGGLEEVKVQLRQAVEWPLQHPESFERLGIPRAKGVLLYGPPGCCKTTLVRAAATACHATFLSVSGAQLYSPYVGDSERSLAEAFSQARAGAPSILFIDEIDSVVGKRTGSKAGGGVQDRVLSTLLNEMDGIGIKVSDLKKSADQKQMICEGDHTATSLESARRQIVDNNEVLVVAATNRPDLLDDALLRPGRFDRIIYVPHPDYKARLEILKVYTRKTPVKDMDLDVLAQRTEGFTGADLENLCREAALHALTTDGLDARQVAQRHFLQALSTLKPSLSKDQLNRYGAMGSHNSLSASKFTFRKTVSDVFAT